VWTVLSTKIVWETEGRVREMYLTIERPTTWEAMARLGQILESNAEGAWLGEVPLLHHLQVVHVHVEQWTSRSDYETCAPVKRTSLLTTRLRGLLARFSGSSLPKPGMPTGPSDSSPN
jgi:hypothetical protein